MIKHGVMNGKCLHLLLRRSSTCAKQVRLAPDHLLRAGGTKRHKAAYLDELK